MKIKDLKTKSEKDLKTLLAEKREALRGFRFGVVGSNARNVKEGWAVKKDVARILTLLNSPKTK
jgi:ribosomal protein L29